MRFLAAIFAILGLVLFTQGAVSLRYGRDLIPDLRLGDRHDTNIREITLACMLFIVAAAMRLTFRRRD